MPSILHGLHNIAGIPSTLAKFERLIGLDSYSVTYPTNFHPDQVDKILPAGAKLRVEPFLERFDIFNFNFGNSIFEQTFADLEILRNHGKKIILHYHGCDIRDSKLTLERHPISACAECWPMACTPNRKTSESLRRRFAHRITVSTPDLLEFEPDAMWLPQAVDLDYIRTGAAQEQPAFQREDDTIYIVHPPSASHLKGTRFIERAVQRLQTKGLKIKLIHLTGMPHKVILATLAAADLVIDQVLIGIYGVVAVEAMALGKPTLCYLREDLVPYYPDDLPVINAPIVELERVISELVEARSSWDTIGQRSVAYAERHHAGLVVAQKLAEVYSQL